MTATMEISYTDLSLAELQNLLERIKQKYLDSEKEHEFKIQLNYNLQREASRFAALEADYVQELELIEKGSSKSQNLKRLVQDVERNIANVRKDNAEQVSILEADIEKKSARIEALKECKSNPVLHDHVVLTKVEHDKLLQEKNLVIAEEENVRELIDELRGQVANEESESARLHSCLESLQGNLEELNRNYANKRKKLQDLNGQIENLQEELALLRNEYESAKHKPLRESVRGNSLFAEVHDRRVQLQKNMVLMKEKFIEMSQRHSDMLQQLSFYQEQNRELTKELEQNVLKNRLEDIDFSNRYKEEIVSREAVLKNLKTTNFRIEISNQDKVLVHMLNFKLQKLKELLEELDKESREVMEAMEELSDKNSDLAECKVKNIRLECELSQLKIDIDLANLELNKENYTKSGEKIAKKPNTDIHKKQCTQTIKNRIESVKQASCEVDFDVRTLLQRKSEQKSREHIGQRVKSDVTMSLKQDLVFRPEGNEENNVVQPLEKSSVVTTKGVREKKQVTFCTGTEDFNLSEKKPLRKNCKIVTCPQVYIPSQITPSVEIKGGPVN